MNKQRKQEMKIRTKLLFPIIVALSAILLSGCPTPESSPIRTADTTVAIAAILGVTPPAYGAIPVTTITETAQVHGAIVWSGAPATFEASTVYSATITLTAKAGYTLTGVAANFFTVAGATSVTNPVNSGVVTAMFPAIVTDYTGTGVGTLKAVQGGTFKKYKADMTVSSFRISQYEITGEQYITVMGGENPGYFVGVTNGPSEMINWYEAIEFCNKLSILEDLTPVYSVTDRFPATGNNIIEATVSADWNANGYRLPTEAEWEFAARGGNSSHNYSYAGSKNADDVAWYFYNAGKKTHPVGTKAANELELYDMSGNVREWCWDWYGTYPATAQTDYRGAATGTSRVIRGGCWSNDDVFVANRDNYEPHFHVFDIGFRVVRP